MAAGSPAATGQITSWQPLGDAPWDQGTRLYVRKTTHVVVAGLPGDSALVDETLPLAETAASYDVGLINQVNAQLLRQEGFVGAVHHDVQLRGGDAPALELLSVGLVDGDDRVGR